MATLNFQGGRIILGTEFSGYKFYFYEPGTSTPKTTYKDSSLTGGNENADPVVLDANGAAQIWFTGNADVVLKTSSGTTVYTDDDINLTPSTTATGSGNLILNPSFEDDTDSDGIPDNWVKTTYTGGTFLLDTTDSYNGATSIKFTSTGQGGGYSTSESFFAVSPSDQYTIGWAMKGTADVRNTVEVLWYQRDETASATASTTVFDDFTTNPTSWTEKWYEVVSPSDAAYAKLRFTGGHSSDATSGTTRYDQVYFTDLAHKRGPNTFKKAVNLAKGTSVAAAGTVDIWATDGNLVHLTGAGTVVSFGTSTQAGATRDVIVDGTVLITHDGTRIVTEGTSNITTQPNDIFKIFADSTTKHYVSYHYPTPYGTYTPALTNGTNVAASTAYACNWMRVGNMVQVFGKLDIDPIAAASTIIEISLPVASTIAVNENLGGVAALFGNGMEAAGIQGNSGTGKATMRWTAVSTANESWSFTFGYKVI